MSWLDHIKSSPVAHLNKHLDEPVKKKKKVIKARNDCPEVVKMHWDLKYWCLEKGYTLEKEYRFSKRRFRFDFAIPELMIGIEYHGLNSEKSGHTTLLGFTKDTKKFNLAVSLGWHVLAFTVLNYKTVLQEVEKNISNKNL